MRALILCSVLALGSFSNLFAQKDPAIGYVEQLQPIVGKLFDLEGKRSGSTVDAEESRLKQPFEQAKNWHTVVLAPGLQPSADSYRFYENALGEADIIRAKFEDPSFLVETAQCGAVMTILMAPKVEGASAIETLQKANGSLFAKLLKVPVGSRLEHILVYPLFDIYLQAALTKTLQSGGEKRRTIKVPDGIQVFRMDGGELLAWYDANRSLLPTEAEELLKKHAPPEDFGVWYRNIFVWTDGKRVGLHFLQAQHGDASVPEFGYPGDWFGSATSRRHFPGNTGRYPAVQKPCPPLRRTVAPTACHPHPARETV